MGSRFDLRGRLAGSVSQKVSKRVKDSGKREMPVADPIEPVFSGCSVKMHWMNE